MFIMLARLVSFQKSGRRVSVWQGNTRVQGQYYAGGVGVGYYANGMTRFQHKDWLGTERIRTRPDGSVEGRFYQGAFGDNLQTQGYDTDGAHFAGQDADTNSGTSHAQFRQLDIAHGKWMSPDPYNGSYDLSNPQSLNRYSYALNNPLTYIDPSGLECVWEDGSYDGEDDAESGTGNPGGCGNLGGAWVDHDYFTQQGLPDWSGTGSTDLAGIYTAITSSSTTVNVYANGSGSSMTTNVGYSPSFGVYFTTQGSSQGPDPTIALATAVAKKTNCAKNAVAQNAGTIGLDALGSIPGEGQISAVASVGFAALSSAYSSVTRDTVGGTLSAGNTANRGLVYAAKENGFKVIPVLGNIYSGLLTLRDIKNASAQVVSCF